MKTEYLATKELRIDTYSSKRILPTIVQEFSKIITTKIITGTPTQYCLASFVIQCLCN